MVYFVTHPNLGTTALVHAPATEKARTTFLDYLERRSAISRADRQYWRKNMIAEKMEDPYDVQADVELNYGYEEGGQRPTREEVDSAAFAGIAGQYETGKFVPRMVDESEGWVGGAEGEEGEEYEEPEQPTRQTMREAPKKLSPIARAALRGYVE